MPYAKLQKSGELRGDFVCFFDLGSVCLPFPWWAASRQTGGGLSSANVCWEKKSEDHYTA